MSDVDVDDLAEFGSFCAELSKNPKPKVVYIDDYAAEADDAIRRSLRELGLSDSEIDRETDIDLRVLAAWRDLWSEYRRQPRILDVAELLEVGEWIVKAANARLKRSGAMLNPGKGRWIPAPRS